MFNIFQFLQLKGIEGDVQKKYFKELDEINDKINDLLTQNPKSKIKEIKVGLPKNSDEKVSLDIHIEVWKTEKSVCENYLDMNTVTKDNVIRSFLEETEKNFKTLWCFKQEREITGNF